MRNARFDCKTDWTAFVAFVGQCDVRPNLTLSRIYMYSKFRICPTCRPTNTALLTRVKARNQSDSLRATLVRATAILKVCSSQWPANMDLCSDKAMQYAKPFGQFVGNASVTCTAVNLQHNASNNRWQPCNTSRV